jgi:hypothetical protein
MRTSLVLSALTLITVGALACGSSSTPSVDGAGGSSTDAPVSTGGAGGTGGTGTGGTGGMATGGTGGTGTGGTGGTSSVGCGTGANTCTQAERNAWDQCVYPKCKTQYDSCYGAGALMGNFSGPCGTWIKCFNTCGCGLACLVTCGAPPAECQSCAMAVDTCQNSSGCSRPACLQPPDAGLPNLDGGFQIPDGGFQIPDGGFQIPDGGFPDLGFTLPDGGLGTCADLLTCCNAIADAQKKATCQQQYAASMSFGDFACGAAYRAHQLAGDCP